MQCISTITTSMVAFVEQSQFEIEKKYIYINAWTTNATTSYINVHAHIYTYIYVISKSP